MAMTPEERMEFNEMKRTVRALQAVEDVSFIESIRRRLDISAAVSLGLNQSTLNDIGNVDTTGVSNGQVIKYNSSNETWENANDIDT